MATLLACQHFLPFLEHDPLCYHALLLYLLIFIAIALSQIIFIMCHINLEMTNGAATKMVKSLWLNNNVFVLFFFFFLNQVKIVVVNL